MTAAIGWFALLAACDRPPGNDGSSHASAVTGDTGPEELLLPGTTVPPADNDDLLGLFQVEWQERDHIFPEWIELVLDAQFWHEIDFSAEPNVVLAAEGLDTCTALTVTSDGSGFADFGDAGVLTVTLDGEVFFEGVTNHGDTVESLYYRATRPEPAFGAIVGATGTGDGVIPPFDFPTIGLLPDGPIGQFTPVQGELVDLRDLSITWDNPIGSDGMYLRLGINVINLDCHVADDGEWTLSDEYVELIEAHAEGEIGTVAATLYRGTPRYIPFGDKVLGVNVGNEKSWSFGGEL